MLFRPLKRKSRIQIVRSIIEYTAPPPSLSLFLVLIIPLSIIFISFSFLFPFSFHASIAQSSSKFRNLLLLDSIRVRAQECSSSSPNRLDREWGRRDATRWHSGLDIKRKKEGSLQTHAPFRSRFIFNFFAFFLHSPSPVDTRHSFKFRVNPPPWPSSSGSIPSSPSPSPRVTVRSFLRLSYGD